MVLVAGCCSAAGRGFGVVRRGLCMGEQEGRNLPPSLSEWMPVKWGSEFAISHHCCHVLGDLVFSSSIQMSIPERLLDSDAFAVSC